MILYKFTRALSAAGMLFSIVELRISAVELSFAAKRNISLSSMVIADKPSVCSSVRGAGIEPGGEGRIEVTAGRVSGGTFSRTLHPTSSHRINEVLMIQNKHF